MDKAWFEMAAERKGQLDLAAWIPLRAVQARSIGQSGSLGFKEDFFGAGSIAVPLASRKEAERLGWMEIGIMRDHHQYIDDGRYVPADIYELAEGSVSAVPLVLEQRGNTESLEEWHLHQDLVISLGLAREVDKWLSINEGYVDVARLHRSAEGKPILLEIRTEHLKDYLCAREMALYVASYRGRTAILDGGQDLSWAEKPVSGSIGLDRWEVHASAIHEGGMPFDSSIAVLQIGRKEAVAEDVPILSLPTDENAKVRSWTRKASGKKLIRVQGELWRCEWIEPAPHSPRARGDELPPTVFFFTDTRGSRESAASLAAGGRWLWFRPDVMTTLAQYRGGTLDWYTRDTGSIACSPGAGVHFGVNRLGLINVYAKDIALLPEWQQRIWSGFNVSPDGGVSKELLASQAEGEPADTQAPEDSLPKTLELINRACIEEFGTRILRQHEQLETLIEKTHRFRSLDLSGLCSLAKDLARLTADSLDLVALKTIARAPRDSDWRSLKALEHVVALRVGAEKAHSLLGPLVGVYELRHADAHLPSSDLEASLKLVGVDRAAPYVHQGVMLLETCVSTLLKIAEALKQTEALAPRNH